jgi:hypothetical protein
VNPAKNAKSQQFQDKSQVRTEFRYAGIAYLLALAVKCPDMHVYGVKICVSEVFLV